MTGQRPGRPGRKQGADGNGVPFPSSLPHYDAHAAEYANALASHDVGEARERLLALLPPAAAILDLGCGPGRDLIAFRQAGHEAIGLEGSPALAEIARAASGAEVWTGDLRHTALPPVRFDGVWAQAVLFHVPTAALGNLLTALAGTLRPGGILYACDPTGGNEEGWVGDRYLAFRRPQTIQAIMRRAGFTLIETWRRPPGLPRRQQTWAAGLWRKAS
ncbi:MAG: hypothetical protein RLY86_77 [Pseudomonadota bacterium]|jgi:SAM-dependent methyltransferase